MRGFAQGFVHGIARVFAQLGSHGQSSTSIARAPFRRATGQPPPPADGETYWRYGTYATHITIYLHQSSHARRMMEVVHPANPPHDDGTSAGCDGIGNSSYPVRPRRVEEVESR